MSFLTGHVSFGRLIDYIDGRLPPDERERVDAHIGACATCAGELARLEQIIGLMRTDHGEDAPEHVIDRARNLMPPAPASRSAAPGWRRVLASLRFDSLRLTPGLGTRSASPGARQLMFSADAHSVDLRIEPVADLWAIAGQVFGDVATGARIELRGEAAAYEAELNEQYEFTLPAVPAGRYTLTLHLAELDIELQALTLGT